MTGLAEAWITVKALANGRAKDAVVILSANDYACRAVGTFFEHEFTPRKIEFCRLGVRCKARGSHHARSEYSMSMPRSYGFGFGDLCCGADPATVLMLFRTGSARSKVSMDFVISSRLV